jgi:hypothetical protein
MDIPNLFSNIIFCPAVSICNMSVTKEQYLEQLETELHKPVKKNFRRRKVYVPHLDHTHSADLVDMKGLSRQNKGFKYILNIIDIWSRYAWSVPLKTKTGVEVAQAFATVFKESGRIPQFLWVDQGKEFYNSHMTELLELHGIKRYSTFGEGKAVVVERLNRTLKQWQFKYFTRHQTRNWVDHNDQLLEQYIHKEHRGIGNRTPYSMSRWPDAVPDNEFCFEPEHLKAKYDIGDFVRISRAKDIFEKGYTANWSQEQFVITSIRESRCGELPMYTLEDWYSEPIQGRFYEPQLQKVKYPNTYLIEKVIKHDKPGKRLLVKWVGFDSRHNKWIPEENILLDK